MAVDITRYFNLSRNPRLNALHISRDLSTREAADIAHCDHYRSLQAVHQALLKAVREVTGKVVEFIQWHTTGEVRPPTARRPERNP